MDFDAGLLLFLFIFFVLPLIQRALGGAKQAPPQGRSPGQRRPGVPPARPEGPVRLPDGSRTEPRRPDASEPARAESERAADLVPDDLWRILTGERRSPAPSQREREPEPELEAEAEWGRDAEDVWQPEETVSHAPEPDETALHQRLERLEALRRSKHEETAPTTNTAPTPAPITVRESTSPPPAYQRSPYAMPEVVAPPPPPSPARPPTADARRRRMAPSLRHPSHLKRAFVLREVLGPPKALE